MVNILSIVFPLYMYPANCASSTTSPSCAWYPFFQAIQANPTVTFNLIINIDSGPGDDNSIPNSDWINVISYANNFNNTRLIGYIDSNPTNIPSSKYKPQLQTYKNWYNYQSKDIDLDGIFVDDMAYSPSSASYYKKYADDIKSIWAAPPSAAAPYIMMNPGSPIDCGFYNNVDSIVSFEDYYSNLSKAPFLKSPYTNCPRYKQAIIIHDFNGTALDQQQVSDDMGETFRVGNLFITGAIQNDTSSENPYDEVPTMLQQLSGSVKATNSWVSNIS
ncbi:Spherulin-4 [Dactylellina cionopaga]|nr:Spherulin-4 [Dactylellina cionopaga]